MVLSLNWLHAIKIRANTDLKGLDDGGIDYSDESRKKRRLVPSFSQERLPVPSNQL